MINRYKNFKFIIFLFITINWVFVIFSFSLQSGEVSGQLSGSIVSWIIKKIESIVVFDFKLLEFLIRKAAHITEFFILGIFVMITLMQIDVAKRYIWALTMCILVAISDETLQLFSFGRAGQISDVLLDSLSALVAIGIIYICEKYKKM